MRRARPVASCWPAYAARLPAVELNNTFYRRPPVETVARWRREAPAPFRLLPESPAKRLVAGLEGGRRGRGHDLAARGGRALREQLGCVLLAAAGTQQRDDEALARLLAAKPSGLPMAMLLPHPSWVDDVVTALLAAHGVALVASDRDGEDEPDLRRSGPLLYLRLRRAHYGDDDVARWAMRLEPFLADGLDAYVFFRHDEDGALGPAGRTPPAAPRRDGAHARDGVVP